MTYGKLSQERLNSLLFFLHWLISYQWGEFMRVNSVLYLLQTKNAENDLGDDVEQIIGRTEVLAEKVSVRQSEFYQAAATGLKPEIAFVIWSHEYNDEPKIEFNSKQYKVIRTFGRTDRKTEIICSGLVNGGV